MAGDTVEAAPIEQLLGSSITYRIAVGPHQGRKVFTLQTVPACDEPFDDGVRKVAGLSLHAGAAARAEERKKVEQLRCYISRPTVSEKRLSLTSNGNVRYQLKNPYRDGTTHVIFEPLDNTMLNRRRRARTAKGRMPGVLHRPTGCPGTEAAGQPDTLGWGTSLSPALRATFGCPNLFPINLSRRVRTQQPVPGMGNATWPSL